MKLRKGLQDWSFPNQSQLWDKFKNFSGISYLNFVVMWSLAQSAYIAMLSTFTDRNIWWFLPLWWRPWKEFLMGCQCMGTWAVSPRATPQKSLVIARNAMYLLVQTPEKTRVIAMRRMFGRVEPGLQERFWIDCCSSLKFVRQVTENIWKSAVTKKHTMAVWRNKNDFWSRPTVLADLSLS